MCACANVRTTRERVRSPWTWTCQTFSSSESHLQAHAERGETEVSMTPEYGPQPYQSGGDGDDLWHQTTEAARDLSAEFETWQEQVTHREK